MPKPEGLSENKKTEIPEAERAFRNRKIIRY